MRGGTVRAHLQAIQRVAAIPGATEHTYPAALGELLAAAAGELGFGQVTVRSELRLADVGQPDLQVVDGSLWGPVSPPRQGGPRHGLSSGDDPARDPSSRPSRPAGTGLFAPRQVGP